ncbi:MAG: hypothetical protein A6F71_09020 [Cycloclasticus sp. symbiont of Poecilosclerida sp. M]|nr:MAG: hypothetical protein A6F71_09020 [Cycloclasticus sp. symbiont of Poecilosclerida sp. M]
MITFPRNWYNIEPFIATPILEPRNTSKLGTTEVLVVVLTVEYAAIEKLHTLIISTLYHAV